MKKLSTMLIILLAVIITSAFSSFNALAEQNRDEYIINVNCEQNIVVVYQRDNSGSYEPYKAFVCSVGTDTPYGVFNISDKYEWRNLFGNVWGQYATRITGHILFHSVPYFTPNKDDLEYEEYNKLGTTASLGCIRLSVSDAKWIYENCAEGTTVRIYASSDEEPLAKPVPIEIDVNNEKLRGWDPTDPDENNPWRDTYYNNEAEKYSDCEDSVYIFTVAGKQLILREYANIIHVKRITEQFNSIRSTETYQPLRTLKLHGEAEILRDEANTIPQLAETSEFRTYGLLNEKIIWIK